MNYRRHILSTLLVMAGLAWAMPAVADPPADGTDSDGSPVIPVENQAIYAPHQMVVGFAERSYGEALLSSGLVDHIIASLDQASVFLYQLADGENPEDASETLAQMAGATFAHPNYLLNNLHPVQGSLAFSDRICSGDFDDQPAARLLDLSVVQQAVTGDATVVAVIDGGIDFDHPGLDGQAASGYDFVDDDDYALDEPGGTVSGHGTFVAGITHLVAPDAEIRAYRIMNGEGQGDGFSLAQAIERAALDECDVINVSVVLTHQHLAVQAAIEQAVARGSAVVAAAGNDATGDPIYPAAEVDAISVAAIDTDLKATEFTNYGEYVDVSAPGLEIYSAYQDPYFAWWSGTSFSTAFVSGQMALLRERFPDADVSGLREIVTSTAQNLDALNPHLPGGLGAGCINLTVALLDDCCEMVGDLNGNGIPFDMADGAAMDAAFATGNADDLGACRGNADLTGDCRIDPDDLNLMHLVIAGDTIPLLECSQCTDYLFEPGLPGGDDCCDQVGDVNGNGIAFELGDAELLESALNTGDASYLGPCIGNADVTGDCVVDASDLTFMMQVIAGNAMPPTECTACGDSWTLVPGIGPDIAIVYSSPGEFHAAEGDARTQTGDIVVAATGSPKNFTVGYVDDPEFLHLLGSGGTTNEPIAFEVTSTAEMPPGVYVDSVVAHVDDVTNSPVLTMIHLYIDSSGTGGVGDQAWVHSLPGSFFEAPAGEDYSQPGSLEIGADGSPKAFTVSHLNPGGFVHLHATEGFTNDEVAFDVVSTAGMAPGVYVDSLIVEVVDVTNSPLLRTIFLNTQGDSVITGGYGSEGGLGLSNYPNPFNLSTELMYTLPVDAEVTLKIYNILGREVITLVEGIKTAGDHRIRWNGTDESGREVTSGIYLYRLQADATSMTRKMILLK